LHVTGVDVTVSNAKNNTNSQVMKADAVLCTLPLGVMKECIRGQGLNSVQFHPPLPDWKAAAIQRMGFGNLNKVRCPDNMLNLIHFLTGHLSPLV